MKKLLFLIAISATVFSFGCGKGGDGSKETSDTLSLLGSALEKVRFPVSLGPDGSVDSIVLARGDSMLYVYMDPDGDYVDSAALAASGPQRLFIVRLMAASGPLRELLSLGSKVPVALRVSLPAGEGSATLGFTVSRGEMRSLAPEPPSDRERDEVKVHNRVIYDNRFCPYELEDGVTMLSMSVLDRYVTFRTEIDVEKLDFFLMKENRDSVNTAVVQSLRDQLADSLTRKSLLEIAGACLGYRNRYVGSDRSDSFDISFTPSDLERLVAVADSVAAIAKRPHNLNKK